MTEIEKIRYAKDFIDKLANGINPVDNSELSETDIVNNVKISRCLFYVSDILRKVIEGNGISVEKKKRKLPFPTSDVLLKEVKASDKPLPVSKFTEYINSFVDTEKYKKLTYGSVLTWLINIGAMYETEDEKGKRKRPTEQGEKLGIYTEKRRGMRGDYEVVMYDRNAQQFIIDNLEAISAVK